MRMKKGFIALQRLLVLGLVVVALVAAEKKGEDTLLQSMQVAVESKQGHRFLTVSELEKQVLEYLGDTSDLRLSEINISMLEENLNALPSVAYAEVYFDLNGKLYTKVGQRNPLLRVLGGSQKGYWDNQGVWFPTVAHYTANVPLILGNPDSSEVAEIIEVHKRLVSDMFYERFVSAYEWSGSDLMVYPRFGVSAVNWGDPSDMFESKRNRLKKAYVDVFPAMGFDRYKSINLKFANQVVGIKREDHGGR